MKVSDILKDELKKLEKSKGADEVLKGLQEGELASLKEAIEDINDLVDKREELHEELDESMNKLAVSTSNFITSLPAGISNEETIRAQLELKKKLVEIEELKLQEKLNEWRDIAELKRELRARVKEFQEKTMRGDIIDQLLEEE